MTLGKFSIGKPRKITFLIISVMPWFESIPYNLSSNNNLWNNPIIINELNLAFSQTKHTIPRGDYISALEYKVLNEVKHKLLSLLRVFGSCDALKS